MANITEIINKYTNGEEDLETTNKALKEAGSSLVIRRDGKMGNALLDIGVGSPEFVIVENNKLTNAAGVPHQDYVYYKGQVYQLDDDGVTLIKE